MTNPRIHVLSSDASGNSDAIISRQILDFLPNKTSLAQADVVVTACVFMNDYKFNHALYDVKCPVVVLDFLEMGWDWGDKDNLLGHGILKDCHHLNTPEYAKLDEWVKQRKPRLTLKRELFKRDVAENMKPINWLCTIPAKAQQTAEQYNARPFEIFSCWGLSHPSRQKLHGEIFLNAHRCGYNVIDSWNEQHLEKRNWVSIHSPWYARRSLEEVVRWHRRAKISVSLFGAGCRSFRDSEAPADCIMARPVDAMAWPFDWDTSNSIQLQSGNEFEGLLAATQRSDLHSVYTESLRTIDRYRPQRFMDEYLMPIFSAL